MSSFTPLIDLDAYNRSIDENPDPRARARARDFSLYSDIPGIIYYLQISKPISNHN